MIERAARDPVAAVREQIDRMVRLAERPPFDWDALRQAEERRHRIAATLGDDGRLLSPAALCEALAVPRHTYDDVVRRYAHGRPYHGAAPRDPKSDVGRVLALLRASGDERFAPRRVARAG